jgi:hypothetical protein
LHDGHQGCLIRGHLSAALLTGAARFGRSAGLVTQHKAAGPVRPHTLAQFPDHRRILFHQGAGSRSHKHCTPVAMHPKPRSRGAPRQLTAVSLVGPRPTPAAPAAIWRAVPARAAAPAPATAGAPRVPARGGAPRSCWTRAPAGVSHTVAPAATARQERRWAGGRVSSQLCKRQLPAGQPGKARCQSKQQCKSRVLGHRQARP